MSVADLESALEFSDWDAANSAAARLDGVPVALATPPPDDRNLARIARRSPSQAIEESLARARLVCEGGAYQWIAPANELHETLRGSSGLPLCGLTVAVKDVLAVRGVPLRAGSAVRSNAPSEPTDAAVVARLRRLGAIIIGTTTLHELAFGVTGVNGHAGTPCNPADPASIPGGSSSGSAAAVADGSARLALGTDTGGSVRIPAAFCGVVGFKPAYDSLSRHGVFPLAPSLDHVGLLSRSVDDVALACAALGRTYSEPRAPRAIGVARLELESADPGVASRMELALRILSRRGCRVREVAWPGADSTMAPTTAIMFAEAAAVHSKTLSRFPERFGADVRKRLEIGLALPAAAYAGAVQRRAELHARINSILGDVDCVVGPTVGLFPPPLTAAHDPKLPARLVANTRLANLVGTPALSIPLPPPGPPAGLQITALEDSTALAVGAWVETVVGRR